MCSVISKHINKLPLQYSTSKHKSQVQIIVAKLILDPKIWSKVTHKNASVYFLAHLVYNDLCAFAINYIRNSGF